MPCIKKCYQQTIRQFQPSTKFTEIKLFTSKNPQNKTTIDQNLKTAEMMLKF